MVSNRRAVNSGSSQDVRVRRAYFDCRFGQLHVRTAFSPSGGFDERTTLLCLHPRAATSRMFDGLLPLIAVDRSVYAPDLPGCGESDASPQANAADSAAAMADLLETLHIRKVDVLSSGDGAAVADELNRTLPGLVRKQLELAERDVTQIATEPGSIARRVREQFV